MTGRWYAHALSNLEIFRPSPNRRVQAGFLHHANVQPQRDKFNLDTNPVTDEPIAGHHLSSPRGQFTVIGEDVAIGADTSIWNHVYIGHGSRIGTGVTIGSLVYIGEESEIGEMTQISGGVYIGERTRIGASCFIGPGAVFCDDPFPLLRPERSETNSTGVIVEDGAVIGAGARLMAGVVVGRRAVVGMGAVIIEDVPAETVVVGSPARVIYSRADYDRRQQEWAGLKPDNGQD